MLAMRERPHVSLNSASDTCTSSLRSVASRSGWMDNYKANSY